MHPDDRHTRGPGNVRISVWLYIVSEIIINTWDVYPQVILGVISKSFLCFLCGRAYLEWLSWIAMYVVPCLITHQQVEFHCL